MSKIAIDARESGTSTGRYVDNLVKQLAGMSLEQEFIILTKPHRVGYFNGVAPNFTILESPYKEFTFSEQLGFLKQIRSLKVDLVHFPIVQQPILYRGKTVTTMNDFTTLRFRNPAKNWFIFSFKRAVYRRVNKVVAKKSKAILAYTNYVKNDIVKFSRVKSNKITVTYLAANKIADKAESLLSLQNSQFIMYVGRPQPHKNLERLVQAFATLKPKYPDLKLVLVGKRDVLYERLEQFVKQQNVADVIFTGFVSEGQLRWLYEATAAYVFPSLSEGFGLPGLEAMVHGAPVISSNATCLPEVYGPAAHYFNPEDITDMATRIDEVLASPMLRKDLIEKGQKQVKKYSWERTAEQTLEVYDQVLTSK